MEYLSFLYYQENHTSVSCLYLYGFRFRVIIQNIFMHRLSFLSQFSILSAFLFWKKEEHGIFVANYMIDASFANTHFSEFVFVYRV